ncbi:MAG: hypothetical protein SOZ48_01450 [Eubacterium sp.]|nr:hypothetical protein [Eubacterium sp.]
MLEIPGDQRELWEPWITDHPIHVIDLAEQDEETRKKYHSDFRHIVNYLALQEGRQEEAVTNARMLFKNGVEFEPVAASITILSREKLKEIYEEVVDTANSGRKH